MEGSRTQEKQGTISLAWCHANVLNWLYACVGGFVALPVDMCLAEKPGLLPASTNKLCLEISFRLVLRYEASGDVV